MKTGELLSIQNPETSRRSLLFVLFRGQSGFSAEPNPAVLVDVDHLNQNFVTFVYNVGNLANPPVFELRDMDQALCMGRISANAPKSVTRTISGVDSPISGSAVIFLIFSIALSHASASGLITTTRPLSSMSIFAPVSATIARITLPPGPITSRICRDLSE